MLKKEFEAYAGYTVSSEDYYRIIEPMYMATSLDKQSFVACLDKKRFAQPTERQAMNRLKKLALNYVNYGTFENWHTLEEAFYDYAEQFYHISGGRNEWCYLRHTDAMNGCVLSIYGTFGRVGGFDKEVLLYDKRH